MNGRVRVYGADVEWCIVALAQNQTPEAGVRKRNNRAGATALRVLETLYHVQESESCVRDDGAGQDCWHLAAVAAAAARSLLHPSCCLPTGPSSVPWALPILSEVQLGHSLCLCA